MTRSSGNREPSLAEQIYTRLKQDIFDYRLLPGDRFTENHIAEQMGSSRTPVREALFRLQRESYVDVLFRSGWQVKPFDFRYFEELYGVRTVLECAAVDTLCQLPRGAAANQTLQQLKQQWTLSPIERLTDGPAVSVMDENFHGQLVGATGNREMTRIHQDLTERLRIVRRLDFTQQDRIAATYDEHAAILEAVKNGQAEDAKHHLQSHIESSRHAVRNITLHMLQEAHATNQNTAAIRTHMHRGEATTAAIPQPDTSS